MRKLLLVILSLLFVIQATAAWNVTSVSIEPSGTITPGTSVLVIIKIDLTEQPALPPFHNLRYSTQLEHPKWYPDFIADGVEYPAVMAGGKSNSFSDCNLTDPRLFAIRLRLEGTAPVVDRTLNLSIIRIEELDETGIPVPRTAFENFASVINGEERLCCIEPIDVTLQTFRSHIEKKSGIGVDTSAAEKRYNSAANKIAAAKAFPPSQYSAANSNISSARSDINEGERLLDKAWAEAEVKNAQIPLMNVDGVIAWYQSDANPSEQPNLQQIIAKRKIAAGYITAANDEITIGNYSQARVMAQEAYLMGDEAYSDAIRPQIRRCCIDPQFQLFIPFGIVAIILIVVGIFWWKKRNP